MNWYAYVGQNPAAWIDPAGLCGTPLSSPAVYEAMLEDEGDGPLIDPSEWWAVLSRRDDRSDPRVAQAIQDLKTMGYMDEYNVYKHRAVKIVEWIPGASGWWNPVTGTIYVERKVVGSPGGLAILLAHEAQHELDFHDHPLDYGYTHRHPRRTDEEMIDDYAGAVVLGGKDGVRPRTRQGGGDECP